MSPPKLRPHAVVFALALSASVASAPACIESPQEVVEYDAVAMGAGTRTTTAGAWSIELSRADVALGPFYFCAAASGSSTLCESSIAELRTVTAVDALSPSAARLGRVRGFTGVIKSAAYDLGISWFDTQTAATPAPAAPGRHSMRIEGVATKGATRLPFTADVDVVPQYQGQNAVPTAPADANVASPSTRLEIRLDPVAWTRQIDFDAALARAAADAVAAGAPAPTALVITPGTPEHNALLVGLKNLAPPELRWVPAPP